MAYTKDGIVRIFHSVHQKEKPPRSCDLPGGFFAPSGMPKPLPLGEVALRSNDGEGKPGTKEPLHSDKHWLLIESSYRCVFVLSQRPCPLRRSAPAPPKGEPLGDRKASSSYNLSVCFADSSPSRGASGETVHFAGTAKASPTRGGGTPSGVTERLYEAAPALCSKARPFAPYRASGVQ